MPRPPRPTDAELAILQVLWEHGPSTVREVHDRMAGSRTVAYTTTLKMLQVMTKKGHTVRETVRNQHVYRAQQGKQQIQGRLLADLVDRAFGGSLSRLVVQALSSRRASPEELREIRRLLAAAKRRRP